jgi:hypothetical protein
MPEQARRHARFLGDVADRGAVDAALGEQADRRVPDPRATGEVFEGRIFHQPALLIQTYGRLLNSEAHYTRV